MATKVIGIANQKGGVGKTTTVINLASCLSAYEKKVLVVDLDPQCNTTSGFGLARQTGSSIYQALLGNVPIDNLLQETIVQNVHIIPAELDLAGAEIEIAQMDGYLHCFRKALAPIYEAGQYDYIFLDCPPSLGILTMNALTAANSLLIPMQCEYYALEGLSVIYRLVEQLKSSGANPGLKIEGIIMTMYDKRTNLSTQVVAEVRKHFENLLYDTAIPRNIRLSEAPSFGKPVILYDPHSTGARAYYALAEEFLKRSENAIVS